MARLVVLVLVYETFATSLSAAIERLEDSFNCSVAAHIHREILSSTLNPAAVREAIEQMDLGHFDKYDQQSHSTADISHRRRPTTAQC